MMGRLDQSDTVSDPEQRSRFARSQVHADACSASQARTDFAAWLQKHFTLSPERFSDVLLAVNEAIGRPAIGELAIDAHDVVAVGDGANDLAMIQKAGLGVAYHAKPVVAQAAGAAIHHNDLTALLYLQGYSDSEIIRKD